MLVKQTHQSNTCTLVWITKNIQRAFCGVYYIYSSCTFVFSVNSRARTEQSI